MTTWIVTFKAPDGRDEEYDVIADSKNAARELATVKRAVDHAFGGHGVYGPPSS